MTKGKILVVTFTATHPSYAGSNKRLRLLLEHLRCTGCSIDIVYQDRFQGNVDEMKAFWGRSFTFLPYKKGSVIHRLKRVLRRLSLPWWLLRAKSEMVSRKINGNAAPMNADSWYDCDLDHHLRKRLGEGQYSAVLCEYFFLSRALLCCPPHVRKLIDVHDLFAIGNSHNLDDPHSAWISIAESEEKRALARADCLLAITDEDAASLRRVGMPQVYVVGHLAELKPCPLEPALNSKQILLVASRHRYNVAGLDWFHQKVFPHLSAFVSPQNVVICGDISTERSEDMLYNFVGRTEGLENYYATSRVVMAPLLSGTGLKIKVIEALGYGRPVVTTSSGAVGIGDAVGRGLLCTDNPLHFAEDLLKVLEDDNNFELLATQAHQFACEYREKSCRILQEAIGEAAAFA